MVGSFSHALLNRASGQRLAIVEGDEELSYYALRGRVARLVEAIRSHTVAPGDRVLIFSEPSAFGIAAHLAAMEAGCVAVPLSPTRSVAVLDARIEHVAPRFALVHEDVAARFAAIPSSGNVAHVIVGPEPLRTSEVAGGFVEEPDPEDLLGIAALFFAPEPAGVPRAVRVGHDNLHVNTEAVAVALSLRPRDRTLLTLPLDDSFGASVLHTHLFVGGTVHVRGRVGAPEEILAGLEAAQATGLYGDPDTFAKLIEEGDFASHELAHLRYVAQAGGELASAHVDTLLDHPVPQVFVMYDQTEATGHLSVLPVHDRPEKRGSVGRGLPDTELEVLGEDGEPAPPGEEGEIVARGPSVTRGYLSDWEGNATHFRDGALRTGDIGTKDEDGYVYLRRRRYG
jgi:acyl-CoA synthetase (AMP-forming)/AMP-acid ligase II